MGWCWKHRKPLLLLFSVISIAVLMISERHVNGLLTRISPLILMNEYGKHHGNAQHGEEYRKANVDLTHTPMTTTLKYDVNKTTKIIKAIVFEPSTAAPSQDNSSTNSNVTAGYRTQNHTVQDNNLTHFVLNIQRHGIGGQNSQYTGTEKVIVMALLSNRTLVMTPFFLHGGHVRGYSTEHMRQFNDTFDVEILNELLPVSTIDEFKKQCNTSQMKIVAWDTTGYELSNRDTFTSKLEMKLPKLEEIINVDSVNISRLEDIVKHAPCLGVYQSRTAQLQIRNLEELLTEVRTHLKRSAVIRNITDTLLTGFCVGKPCLAMHWRNKSAEMPCYFHHRMDQCANIQSELSKVTPNVTKAVVNLMKKEKLECLYVACPQWSMAIIDNLSDVIPREKIYTWKDLPNYNNNDMLRDYYFSALVEQEICYRSKIFIAAGISNWSNFVKNERDIENKTTLNIKALPGIPEYSIRELLK
ncbi:uncharacterized protein LOC102803071 [Saccoglossus kowalevskii]|uniref:GDP-fucose protein O-fucosyltransferase 2 n=1 Tax=Saccoglossus kowalevskii TaxID=10224 RepID=A0ABM0MJ84_SACKO|nr:PREDICTED: uncharacterized protein LOC102803071 [Saccoglossus kowalevskii]